jgi:hypothetical protein
MDSANVNEAVISFKYIDQDKKFWYFKILNKQGDIEWKIDHLKFIEFLRRYGFRSYDINQDYIFIKIKRRIIEEITVHAITDEVIKFIESIDETCLHDNEVSPEKKLTREILLSKFYTSPAIFFNDKKLSMLGIQPDLVLNADTKEFSYIYYKNGFVKCSADGSEILPYKQLDGYVFRNQIKDRDFLEYSPDGMFRDFVFNIAGKKEQRFLALQTMIGYLLHSFYETKMKAVNLTDSNISDNAEGRTGKTLLGHAISHIKNVSEISGKDFDPTNKHKYATAKLDTQIVFLNDLQKKFNFECLFNDISDAITVDRKNMQPFTIRAKMLIAANDTFRIEGASAKDRVIEFELADHYNADFSPEDEFGVWFFRDWDLNEWLRFDNFMIGCLTLYLQKGVIEADPINLDKRKQIQHTNPDFVEFMNEKIERNELRLGFDYDKKDLHTEFLEKYPEYKENRWLKQGSNFTKYLKIFASYSPQLKGKISERRSSGKSFIQFGKSECEQPDLPF